MSDESEADRFIRRFHQSGPRRRSRLAGRAPIAAIQKAAQEHSDPFVRRDCLSFLDHYANDESMRVFAAALRDPVDFVRNIALHSIACKRCKTDDLCAAYVVPALIGVLRHDRRAELRIKSIGLLAPLVEQDPQAGEEIARAAAEDKHDVVRAAALDALTGRYVAPTRRYERRERHLARRAASGQAVKH